MGTIAFNPMLTTGIPDAFVVQTGGYVQGTFLDDPAMRYQLEGGYVASTQSTPLWGGLPLTLAVPNVNANEVGPAVVAAASLAAINAWSIFNMSAAGIITPSSNVPLFSSGMSINFARPGSLLRVVLPVNAAVLNSLATGAPNVSLYWDPTNLRLDTASSGNYGPLPVQIEFLSNTSKTVTYSGGLANWNPSGAVAVVRI